MFIFSQNMVQKAGNKGSKWMEMSEIYNGSQWAYDTPVNKSWADPTTWSRDMFNFPDEFIGNIMSKLSCLFYLIRSFIHPMRYRSDTFIFKLLIVTRCDNITMQGKRIFPNSKFLARSQLSICTRHYNCKCKARRETFWGQMFKHGMYFSDVITKR